jgi:hypothetical protein
MQYSYLIITYQYYLLLYLDSHEPFIIEFFIFTYYR